MDDDAAFSEFFGIISISLGTLIATLKVDEVGR